MERQFDLQAANWNVANWNESRAGHRLAVWAALSLACCALAYCSLFTWYPGSVASYGVDFRRALTWELLRWNLWLPVAALILRWNRAAPPRGIAAALRYAASAILFPALHIALLLAAYFPFSPAGLVAFLRHRAYVSDARLPHRHRHLWPGAGPGSRLAAASARGATGNSIGPGAVGSAQNATATAFPV
jgi:hypothetical protein